MHDKQSQKNRPEVIPQVCFYFLVIFAFSCCFGLFLTSYAGLLVMLALTDFLLDTSLRAASLKATKRTVQSLVFFYDYV